MPKTIPNDISNLAFKVTGTTETLTLTRLFETYGEDKTREALQKTLEKNIRKLSYTESILENMKEENDNG